MNASDAIKSNAAIKAYVTKALDPLADVLEPDRLVFPQVEGMLTPAAGFSPETGLHVVVGFNNSGKTRLLEHLQYAQFSRTFKVDDLGPRLQWEIQKHWGERIDDLPQMTVIWSRLLTPDAFTVNLEDRRKYLRIGIDPKWRAAYTSSPDFEAYLNDHFPAPVRLRPAILIPTDRFIREGFPLADAGELTLPNFVPTLETLKREDETRETYDEIAEGFRDITDGLVLDFGGATGGLSRLDIIEKTGRRRKLDDCGDGLRDLVYILTYSAIYSHYDLLIDEPGLRLHPHAQRKLLGALEKTAAHRAIWIASHDPVFVATTAAPKRYYVKRDVERHVSEISELLGQEELRRAVLDLGFTRQDVLFADVILYCEGPADQLVYENVIQELAADNPHLAGTIVVQLRGHGEVWARKPGVLETIALIRRISVLAKHVILIDSDGKPDGEKRDLKEYYSSRDVCLQFLERRELENYFLSPAVVLALLNRAVKEWDLSPVPELPTAEELERDFGQLDQKMVKGSELLKKIAHGLLKKDIAKPDQAKWALSDLRKLAPALADELKAVVHDAIRDF